MFIWAILLALFICGIVIVSTGRISVSQKRHVIGKRALLVGVGMLILPFSVFGSAILIGVVGAILNWHPDTVQNSATICSLAMIVIPALAIAIKLKRWAVPIDGTQDAPNFDQLNVRSSQSDFDFLDIHQED